MRDITREQLLGRLKPDDRVLDIGGWGDPFERADWVMDLFPYETRGLYEREGWIAPRADAGPERFSERTWVQRDICGREPFPFEDDEFDFVICSHTLEDLRDPVWVCSEMQRIAKAGYIEVPSRLEEQSWGVVGQFVGWSHHHWLIDVGESSIEFVFKPHEIHAEPSHFFPAGFHGTLSEEEKVSCLWWEESFAADEGVIFGEPGGLSRYLGEFVQREMLSRGFVPDSAKRRPAGALSRILRSGVARATTRGGA